MTAKEDLFVLIQSLTKTEKAYFKKYASIHSDSDKVYLLLFDLINEMEEYDEAALKKKVKHPGLLKHFAVYKNYLYKTLLRSLAQYVKTHTDNFGLEEILLEIEVLLSKNLFTQCVSLINRAKEIARENENFPALLKVIQLEIRYVKQSPKVKNWSESYEKAVQEEAEVLKKLADVSLTRNLNADMFLFLQKHFQEERTVEVEARKSELLHRLQMVDGYTSAECEINHLSAWVNYYKFTEEPENALPYQIQAIKIFKKHHFLIHNEALRYINSLSNLLIIQEQLGNDEDFNQALQDLNAVTQMLPKNLLSPNLQLHVFALALRHELKFLVNRNQFEAALKVSNESKKKLLANIDIINEVFLYQIYFYNARVFFELNKTKETIFWLQQILQTSLNKYNKRFHFFAKMLQFLLYWDDDNALFVDSLSKSLVAFIKYQKLQADAEKLIIKTLMNISKQKYTAISQKVMLQRLYDDLVEQNATVLENYFDFIGWLKKKIQ